MPNYVTPDSLGTDGSVKESWSPAARKAALDARKRNPFARWNQLSDREKQAYKDALKKVYAGRDFDNTNLAKAIRMGKASLTQLRRVISIQSKPMRIRRRR